jgi:alpha-tubulin suppressor-like RCC1 family protein
MPSDASACPACGLPSRDPSGSYEDRDGQTATERSGAAPMAQHGSHSPSVQRGPVRSPRRRALGALVILLAAAIAAVVVVATGGDRASVGSAQRPRVAVGDATSCVLATGGTVECWGYDRHGETGSLRAETNCGSAGLTAVCNTQPTAVSIPPATAIAAGAGDVCALSGRGEVYCWGYNGEGELGTGHVAESAQPLPVAGVKQARAVAVGGNGACALLANGTVDCWGDNNYGELGIGTDRGPETCASSACSRTPVRVALRGAVDIAAGGHHYCALLAEGQIECWGSNIAGELGNDTTGVSSTPVPVTFISPARQLAAGQEHTCALLLGGTVDCWGGNAGGQLGIGTNKGPQTCTDPCSKRPVRVDTIDGQVAAIAAGGDYTCALLTTGRVDCWGDNASVDLETPGTSGSASCQVPGSLRANTCSPSATPSPGIGDAVAIGTGSSNACALLKDASVECWGDNTYGELGNGATTASGTPVRVNRLPLR